MENNKKKLFKAGAVLAFFVVAVGVWQGWEYFNSSPYRQMKAAKDFEKLFTDDKMGGKTPEETLALFTEAVAKEDFDLASQYGTWQIKEQLKKDLLEYRQSKYWSDFRNWLNNAKKNESKEYDYGPNSTTFESFDNNRRRVIFISIDKNKSNIWKITEF